MKRVPILPTLIVFAACAMMIALGVWQLQRSAWKTALIASAATHMNAGPLPFPAIAADSPIEPLLFRPVAENCLAVKAWRSLAGQNRKGEIGWLHVAQCTIARPPNTLQVDIGWSRTPASPDWRGGMVAGLLTTDRETRLRLVARDAAPGLEPSRQPSPDDLPNNHFGYAMQWFFFALIAAGIYAIALRKRLVGETEEPKG